MSAHESPDSAASVAPSPARRSTRLAWKLVKTLLIAYIVVILLVNWLQEMLVFPGAGSQGRPQAQFLTPAGAERVELQTAGGEAAMALFGPALDADGAPRADAADRPTILFFYGNGDCLAHMVDEFQRFRRLGANVMIPEYEGYGLSAGKPSEVGCYATAAAAYDWLTNDRKVKPRTLIVGGWSLGAAVALDLAVKRQVGGLFMWSPFTSGADVGARQFPFLPVRWLLRHRFENLAKIGQIKVPIVIAHGRLDVLVPYDMSDRLAAASVAPVIRVTVDNAGHNDLMASGNSQLMQATRELIERVMSPARTVAP